MTPTQKKVAEELTRGCLCCTLPRDCYGDVRIAPLGENGGRTYQIGKRGKVMPEQYNDRNYYGV